MQRYGAGGMTFWDDVIFVISIFILISDIRYYLLMKREEFCLVKKTESLNFISLTVSFENIIFMET